MSSVQTARNRLTLLVATGARALSACLFGSFVTLSITAPAQTAPITLSCTMIGSAAASYGRLTVSVDLEARSVDVAAYKVSGVAWRFHDGVTASGLVKGPDWLVPYYPPVRQFVRITSTAVIFGWQPVGEDAAGAVGSFNRSVIDKPRTPCRWHQSRPFLTAWRPWMGTRLFGSVQPLRQSPRPSVILDVATLRRTPRLQGKG